MTRPVGRRDDRGAVAVEFALVFPLAVVMIGFLTALGLRVFWAALADNATRSAVHYASIANTARHYPKGNATVDGMKSVSSQAGGAYSGVLGSATVTGSVCSDPVEANCDPSVLPLAANFQCDKSGNLITVEVTYQVPGLSGLQGLINAIPGAPDVTQLATVTNIATARCE